MDASSLMGPSSADAPTDGEHRMGTTIVGVCYDCGVVLAADSRTSTGSGSSYLYGLMDHEWKEGMTQEEAEKFVVKVVSLAIARDGASGGVVRTVTINEEGVKRSFHPGDKLPLWHEEMEPQNSLLDILAAGSSDAMVQ